VDLTTRSRQLTDKLTARQQAILEWLRTNQPATLPKIAHQFNCSVNTAKIHMDHLRKAGQAWPGGRGVGSKGWSTNQPFEAPKTPPPVAPPSIEQVLSIWHYARRCARAA
jgi:DNA-binding CsgD family transcriptional regulator